MSNKTGKSEQSKAKYEGLWKRVLLYILIAALIMWGFQKCQTQARKSRNTAAQWALNNLAMAQSAYFHAYNTYSHSYDRLAGFGFQSYGNVYYSDITVSDNAADSHGWRANVRYKNMSSPVYNYDSQGGGFLDIAN